MTLINNIQNKTKDFSLTFFLIFTIIFFFSGCSSDDSNDKTSVVTKTENLVDETVSEDSDDSGVADVNGSFVDISDDTNTTQEDNTTQTVATDTNATQTTTTDTNSTTLITDPNTTTPKVVVINGHTLPPVPDKTLNDSTLLGIDSNDNGVRDDVEIWIYTYYSKPIEHAVFMQSARAYQIVIQEPEKALETMKYLDDVSDCESYWRMSKEDAESEGEIFWLEEYKNYDKDMNPVQFNTADRFLAYKKYNQTLSGGVYSSSPIEEWKNRCDFNSSDLVNTP